MKKEMLTKIEFEKLITEIADEIASVDSHYINAIGAGGTVAAQIIRKKLEPILQNIDEENSP